VQDLRTILCARIYEKALTVSAEDKAKLTTGEVVNLMSADAEKVVYLCIMFHGLWTTPLFLVAAIWLLVNLVGVAIVPGLAMLFVTAPIQGYVISQQHKLQRAVMHKSDARVKLVNEVLQGVRVVKYYNWEDSFEKRLADARAEEVKLIKKLARINAFNSALMMTVPMLMLIAMLITIFATGGDFSPTTVFVAVSLLVLLRFPLIMLPMTIGMCVMGRISLKRIERFLLLGDMPRFKAGNKVSAFTQLTLPALTMVLPRGTVKVEAGAFQWALGAATEQNKKKKAAVLIGAVVAESKADTSDEVAAAAAELVHDASESLDAADAAIGIEGETVAVATWRLTLPTFETAAGSLVAVTGRVGSGKSSLLAALLGELDPSAVSDEASPLAGGSSATAPAPPVLRGSVGYAAQQPWIMNATLRDNVLFGQDFNEHKYREVLECCCLGPDLAALPAGDMTEIGEKV
jgi:ABC-type multidrug transport system fused ATPase/permease subunit